MLVSASVTISCTRDLSPPETDYTRVSLVQRKQFSHVGDTWSHGYSVAAGLGGGSGVETVLVRSQVKLTSLARPVPRTCSWARSSVGCAWSWWCLWLIDSWGRSGSSGHTIVYRTTIVCSIDHPSIAQPTIVLAIPGACNIGLLVNMIRENSAQQSAHWFVHSGWSVCRVMIVVFTKHQILITGGLSTWSGVGVGWLAGGLETGVGEAGRTQDSGARMLWSQGSAQVSSWQWSGAGMVQTEPAPVLWPGPAPVWIILLDCVHWGCLLLRLQLHCVRPEDEEEIELLTPEIVLLPGEWAGHGGAEEDVDAEHDEEQDSEHYTQPQQPGGSQLTVSRVGWNKKIFQLRKKRKYFVRKLEIFHQDTRKYFNNKIFQPSVARLESLVLGNLNIGSIYYRVMMWSLLSWAMLELGKHSESNCTGSKSNPKSNPR